MIFLRENAKTHSFQFRSSALKNVKSDCREPNYEASADPRLHITSLRTPSWNIRLWILVSPR